MSLRPLQVNLPHSKAVSAALLLRLTEGGADLALVQEPLVVGGKVAGLGTKEYKLMLDPKIRTCRYDGSCLLIILLSSNRALRFVQDLSGMFKILIVTSLIWSALCLLYLRSCSQFAIDSLSLVGLTPLRNL